MFIFLGLKIKIKVRIGVLLEYIFVEVREMI